MVIAEYGQGGDISVKILRAVLFKIKAEGGDGAWDDVLVIISNIKTNNSFYLKHVK